MTKERVQMREGALSLNLRRERIATQCICCGSEKLQSSPAVLMPFVAHRTFDWQPVVIDDSWGLRTIKSGHAYSLCKSLYCNDCGFLFLDIRFSENELANLYLDYRGYEYTALRESYEPGYTKWAEILDSQITYICYIEELLRPHLSFPITILDWGGASGENTPFKINNEGFDIYDISERFVIPGARRVSKLEAQSRKYKLVVCSNVLEHVPYPSDLLNDISKTMCNESVLYIEVPLESIILSGDDDLHLLKRHWHEHINFFSEKSLRILLEKSGFEVIDLQRRQVTVGERPCFIFQIACRLKL